MKLDLDEEWAEFERAWSAFWEVNARIDRDRLAGQPVSRALQERRHDLYTRAFAAQDRLQIVLKQRMQAYRESLP